MDFEEIKELCRAAKDRGDTEAFIEAVALFKTFYPDWFQEFMVELETLANEPGSRLQ